MIVITVRVRVRPCFERAFLEATRVNHEGSLREPGCLRFDILQVRGEPGSFLLVEAWDSDADAAKHKETDHYRTWRAAVEEWMAEPRLGTTHEVLAPLDRALWKAT